MYLVGDIGGTKTNIAIVNFEDGKFKFLFEESFANKNYDSLITILKNYFDEKINKNSHLSSLVSHLTSICFGIAGPIKDGNCDATNLPWIVNSEKISEALNIDLNSVSLVNDLEAAAYGIELLDEKDIFILNKGITQRCGNRALISAGTGLGESIIFWDGKRYRPSPSEGGHTDFAPRNKIEINLLNYLINKYGRISYERILSGPGLLNVYNFFCDMTSHDTPQWLKERFKNEDPSAVISDVGMSKQDRCCEKALDLFVSVYGAEAGNLALTALATGGIYVGGGIAPKILNKIKEGGFMQAFTNKGRLSVLISQIPVRVILNDKIPLLGAANYVRLKAENESFVLLK